MQLTASASALGSCTCAQDVVVVCPSLSPKPSGRADEQIPPEQAGNFSTTGQYGNSL